MRRSLMTEQRRIEIDSGFFTPHIRFQRVLFHLLGSQWRRNEVHVIINRNLLCSQSVGVEFTEQSFTARTLFARSRAVLARVSLFPFALRSLYENKHRAFDTSLVCILNSHCFARKVNEERRSVKSTRLQVQENEIELCRNRCLKTTNVSDAESTLQQRRGAG